MRLSCLWPEQDYLGDWYLGGGYALLDGKALGVCADYSTMNAGEVVVLGQIFVGSCIAPPESLSIMSKERFQVKEKRNANATKVSSAAAIKLLFFRSEYCKRE